MDCQLPPFRDFGVMLSSVSEDFEDRLAFRHLYEVLSLDV